MAEDRKQSAKQEVAIAIANTKQNIRLLRSQVRNNRIDKEYFDERLKAIVDLLDDIEDERADSRQQNRVATLYEVSRAIGSSLNLQTVLDQVMDAIIQLTGAERGFLMLLDDDGNLEVRVARNFDQETLDNNEFAISQTITRQVFDTGDPVVTTNAQEDPRYAEQASIIMHGMRSIMASPLRARGQTTGVVYVDNRVRTAMFEEDDLATLDTFASQAAVAIDNARLYGETDAELQARHEELRMLQWIDRQLNETLDMEKSLNLTVEWAVRLAKADSGSIGLFDPNRNAVDIRATFGEDDPFAKMSEVSMGQHVIHDILEADGPVIESESANGHETTTMGLPIRLVGDTIGVILLTATRANAFGENEQALVARMAERAASAIQNSRLYAAVIDANRAKSEFVSVVAHELKVPMTSIRGYASMIEMTTELDDRQKGFIRTIEKNVERMRILVEDLNDISRIESGQMNVEMEDVDLYDVFEQAVEGVQTQMAERGHTFVEEVEDDLPFVRGNQIRLVQVMTNLLSNAYKYTPDNGQITLQAIYRDGRVEIAVVDNGIGMTDEQLQLLGTKFFRADHDHVLQQSGTGLGFAITANLVNIMGGELRVESALGKGSTFSFDLAAADQG